MEDERFGYEAAGVDYEVLDAGKRAALGAAASTEDNARRLGAAMLAASRGEPASVFELGGRHFGFVLECLGTKSLIARELEGTGVDGYEAIGYDTVAAAVNDCCCVGALPVTVSAYFATGAAAFYSGTRHSRLVEGFRRGCDDAGAIWGGGESPTLAGLVEPGAIDLAAATVGVVPPGRQPVLGAGIVPGDDVVFVASSGLHANGASLARAVAASLPESYATPLGSGRSFGEALLDASVIYVPFVDALLGADVDVHYLSHITGHGLRKVMRAACDVTYRISDLPEVPEVLAFLAASARLSPADAYGTLNMGVGFMAVVAAGAGDGAVARAEAAGMTAMVAGRVERGPRRVVLEPVGVEFAGADLDLR